MSRNLSDAHIRAANAPDTGECWCTLLVINHASLEEPLRFNNAGADIVSNGETYFHYPFNVVLFQDDEEAQPTARLQIDNIQRDVIETIRTLRPEPEIKISVVLASNPDAVELAYPFIPLKNISYDEFLIQGVISAEDFTGEPFPGDRMVPSAFPGLF